MKEVVIASIAEETPGVKTFTIASGDGSEIPYAAGQFITFVFTHHGREERRSYSISFSPVLNEPLTFTVKRLDNGAYSRLLVDRARVGDVLYTTGAAGLFTLPQNDDHTQVFLFAGGIGITPIFSLVKTILHSRPDKQVVLVYSNRSQEEVVFYNELNALAKKYPARFKVDYLYSTSYDLGRARLNKSLIPVLLKEYGVVPTDKMLFYICGPFDYMRMAMLTLEELGFDSSQVKRENFNTNNRVISIAEPPDKAPRNVTILFAGKEQTIPVVYPDTILKAAKKQGISLPYSCETGRCGSCAALCTHGKVWMSYNEVLMENDLQKGMILTCVGHPVNGDVTIQA